MKITMKPRVLQVKNALMAFATPIHQARYEGLADFNAELAKKILAMRDSTPSQHNSNQGGWQSEKDLLAKLGEPYAGRLANMFMEGVWAAVNTLAEPAAPPPTQVSLESWANVNQRGDSNSVHIHPGSPWSGTYYVSAEQDAGAEIYFVDPRTSALMNNHPLNPFNATNNVSIAPVPGMMLVFPSFLFHGVKPYRGETPRISIAFNLR